MSPSQLVLRFPRQHADAAELLPNAAQDEARRWLEGGQPWPLNRLALWGAAGSGKSHLARAWAQARGGLLLERPLQGDVPGRWPACPIALDAGDAVPDELALLYLLNAAAESGQPVLLVSRAAPGRLPVRLPDLASRLRATTAVPIGPADDAFLALLLTRLLSDEQLHVPADLQSWLLTRLPRSPAAVRDAVARLDAAGLVSGRTLTRPVATEVLGLHDNSAADAPAPSPHPTDKG